MASGAFADRRVHTFCKWPVLCVIFAGKLCVLVGSCDATSSCVITTKSISSGAVIKQTLDQCSVEGVSNGQRVTGVSASAALAPGRCYAEADCSSDGRWQCSFASNVSITTCAAGKDNSVDQGLCQLKPAAVCTDCLSATQSFAVQHLLDTSAEDLTTAWNNYCGPNKVASTAQCLQVTAQLDAQGVTAGKRAAYMCATMLGSHCSRDLNDTVKVFVSGTTRNVSASQLDLCTVEGVSYGTYPPSVMVTASGIPGGYCQSAADCANPTDTCDTNKTNTVNYCNSTTGVSAAVTYGTCVPNNTAAACSQCSSCLNSLQSYVASVRNQSDAAAVAEAWEAVCNATKYTSAQCNATATRIRLDRKFGQRAGALCVALKQCNTALACSINLRNTTNAALDTCTAEVSLFSCMLVCRICLGLCQTRPQLQSSTMFYYHRCVVTKGMHNSLNYSTVRSCGLAADNHSHMSMPVCCCCQQGVKGGSSLPNVATSNTPPAGSCLSDTGCGTGKYCDTSSTTQFCFCSDGTDSCSVRGMYLAACQSDCLYQRIMPACSS